MIYHEPAEELGPQTRDYHRALRSLLEEVEAIDWYQQRLERAGDEQLRRILEHNRNEEIEHACMMLEWLRRSMPGWDERLRRYLFAPHELTTIEEETERAAGGLKIGALRGA